MRILNTTINGINISLGYRLLLATIPTVGLLMLIFVSRLVGGPDWEWSDWIYRSVLIFYAALFGVFILVPFITTKSRFGLRVSALVLASILIPPFYWRITGSWTDSSSWTWSVWSVYTALFGAFVLVAYMTTKNSFNLRISALVLACPLITPVWELIEKGHGFLGFRPYSTIFDGVTITLLYAVVLIFAASLRVSRVYWLYTTLAGIVGAYISFRHLFELNEYVFVIALLTWQLLFCTAVYYGKTLGPMSTLATEIAKFRQWAIVRQSPDYHHDQYSHGAEWECDYPDWQDFYAAVGSFLETAAHQTLTTDELEQLLYALARDNEDEVILQSLEKFPAVALQVVQAAVSFPDPDARWQAAVLAGQINATAIVRRFLDDEDEYVRRRAGFALQEMESRV